MIKKIPITSKFSDYGFLENKTHYWSAQWFSNILGYKSLKTFTPSINKAKNICVQLNIPVDQNFIPMDDSKEQDYKLTKFACFLTSLQADARKPIVKRARQYFLNEMEVLNDLLINENYLERNVERNNLRMLNKDLARTARRAHVNDFMYFQNEGYLGMYNHTVSELREMRGLKKKESMLDKMDVLELAAHIFRITLVNEKLKYTRNPSETKSAREHWKIGAQIRSMIKENAGVYPEEIPLKGNLLLVEKKIKKAHKQINKPTGQTKQIQKSKK